MGLVFLVVVPMSVCGGCLLTTTLSSSTLRCAAANCSCRSSEHEQWWFKLQTTSSEQEQSKRRDLGTSSRSSWRREHCDHLTHGGLLVAVLIAARGAQQVDELRGLARGLVHVLKDAAGGGYGLGHLGALVAVVIVGTGVG